MSKPEQDKKPISKRTKKKKTKKDKKKKQKKKADKSKVPKGVTININVGKSGGDAKAKAPKTAKGFVAKTTSMRGQRGRGNLSDNSRQAEMNTNIMQNVSGIRSTAMQQGLDLKDLAGNFNTLQKKVNLLGSQVLNPSNQQQQIANQAFQDNVTKAIRENEERQLKALKLVEQGLTQAVTDGGERLVKLEDNMTQSIRENEERQVERMEDVGRAFEEGQRRIADVGRSVNEAITQGDDTQTALAMVAKGIMTVSQEQDNQMRQADETQQSMLLLNKAMTGVMAEQYQQNDNVLRIQGQMNQGVNSVVAINDNLRLIAEQTRNNARSVQQMVGNIETRKMLDEMYPQSSLIPAPQQQPMDAPQRTPPNPLASQGSSNAPVMNKATEQEKQNEQKRGMKYGGSVFRFTDEQQAIMRDIATRTKGYDADQMKAFYKTDEAYKELNNGYGGNARSIRQKVKAIKEPKTSKLRTKSVKKKKD